MTSSAEGRNPWIDGTTRLNVLKLFIQSVSGGAESNDIMDTKQYCRRLEELTFCYYGDDEDTYQRKIQQLAYNLNMNSRRLVYSYEPCQLIGADDIQLSEGTAAETKRKLLAQEMESKKAALNMDHLFDDYADKSSVEKCPRCRRASLNMTPVSSRGADEGQIVHVRCLHKDCGHKWTIRS